MNNYIHTKMNYDLYLLSKLLIDNGAFVNGVNFESMPYDEQYEVLSYVWDCFIESDYNSSSKPLYECIDLFLKGNKNIVVDINIKEINHLLDIVISSCREGMSGDWDCCSQDGKEGFDDMIKLLYKVKYLIKNK